jgi:hypothetical protein
MITHKYFFTGDIYGFWTLEEKKIVEDNWPNYRYISEFKHLLKNRSERAIDDEARRQALKRDPKISNDIKSKRQDLLVKRNKTTGRDISLEFAKQEVLKYKSKQEFRNIDSSLYSWTQKNGLMKELTSHMILGDTYRYPQNFLYECVKQLFPNEEIVFNDRTAIKPKEIDVYIPSKKWGFEYDGLHYHQHDSQKSFLCESIGIKLLVIKETSKSKPEQPIIDFLLLHGFDTNKIDIKTAIKSAYARKITPEEVDKILTSYSEYTKFYKEQQSLINYLRKIGKFEEKTSHMKRYRGKSLSKEEVRKFLESAETKSEIYKNLRFYSKMIKINDPELNQIYSTKLGRNLPSWRSKVTTILDSLGA